MTTDQLEAALDDLDTIERAVAEGHLPDGVTAAMVTGACGRCSMCMRGVAQACETRERAERAVLEHVKGAKP